MESRDESRKESETTMSGHSLQTLSSAHCAKIEIYKEYKSGASYKGPVENNRRTGTGLFIWSNGAQYEGEFCDDVRNGNGKQLWPDGTVYEGEFVNDLRHGQGTHLWTNGEKYSGSFFKDRRHGLGEYHWPDESSYTGTFYMDAKEGYGTFIFANGNKFEGLYKSGEREGPGILTYPDGRQDVGLWHREKLVRLCQQTEGAFVLDDYPELKYNPADHKVYITPLSLRNRMDVINHILNPPDQFNYEPHTAIKTEAIFTEGLHPQSLAVDLQTFDEEFFKQANSVSDLALAEPMDNGDGPNVSSKGTGQVSKEMLKSQSAIGSAGSIRSQKSELASSIHSPKLDSPNSPSILSQKSEVSSAHSQKSEGVSTPKDTPGDSLPKDSIKSEKSVAGSSHSQSPEQRIDSGISETLNLREESANSVRSQGSRKSVNSEARSEVKSQAAVPEEKVVKKKEEEKEEEEEQGNRIVAWNRTPANMDMQRHVIRHQAAQGGVSFNVEAVLEGRREDCMGRRGPLETAAEDLLQAARKGDVDTVSALLKHGMVDVDVADNTGHTPLIGAAINWHIPVINCLLDNGANINKLTDAGVSALAACHVYFYPEEKFKYNTAEKDLVRPVDFEKEEGYDVSEAVRNILNSKTQRHSSKPPSSVNADSQISPQQADKIQQLRSMYGGGGGGGTSVASKGRPSSASSSLNATAVDSSLSADRTLGTLNVKRWQQDGGMTATNAPDTAAASKLRRSTLPHGKPTTIAEAAGAEEAEADLDFLSNDAEAMSLNEFESHDSAHGLEIPVNNMLIERGAMVLSSNGMVVDPGRRGDPGSTVGTARTLAVEKKHEEEMKAVIRLLLKRGADPNASCVPMPVLFFAIKAADVEAVNLLLMKGASTQATLSKELGGLAPLHIAAAIPGEEGVEITKLLLDALADPDVRATPDDSFLNTTLQEDWQKDELSPQSLSILGGRTPLMIACNRDDNYKNACKVVDLLLGHHANPNLLCNGYSPLALAITSGNDYAVLSLLQNGANPCLPLTHGAGNAMCVAASTEYEHRRTPAARIALIDTLMKNGADVLAPIPIGVKRLLGTAVDYAYYMYNQDRRIAHMPYHALTHAERETYNARRRLLAHMGDLTRERAIEREKQRLQREQKSGRVSRSPSPNFLYTGSGVDLAEGVKRNKEENAPRKPLYRYCYECGRSVGVRLAPCTRCKEVYYCSKACKIKGWNARHKEECVRIGGEKSPSPNREHKSAADKRADSPTPQTNPDRNKPVTKSALKGGLAGSAGKGPGARGQFFEPGGKGQIGGGGGKGQGKVYGGSGGNQGKPQGASYLHGNHVGGGFAGGKYPPLQPIGPTVQGRFASGPGGLGAGEQGQNWGHMFIDGKWVWMDNYSFV